MSSTTLDGFRTSASAIRRFRGDLLAYWPRLLLAVLAALGYAAARLLEPWPLKVLFDNVLTAAPLDTPVGRFDRGDRTTLLVLITAAIVALAVARSVFYYGQRVLTARVGQDVVTKARRRLFAHVQRLPLSFHTRASTGDLLTRLTGDIAMLRELLVASLTAFVAEGIVVIGFVAVMFWVEWRLALAAVLVVPVILIATTMYSARMRAAASKQRRREGELAGRLHEVLSGIYVVQLFGREDEEDARLRALNKRSSRSGLKAVRLEARLNRAVEVSVGVGTAIVLWIGATQVIAGRLTPGELVVFFVYVQGFYRPLRRMSRVAQRASKASTCLERVTNVLDRDSELRDGQVEAPPIAGTISFERVSFAYGGAAPALRDVGLEVPAGRTVAIVGPTGAGKTTLLGLVPRLHDPSSGVVRIDGIDVRDLTLRSLRDQIAVVPQDGTLFAGTMYENIAYGDVDAEPERVEAAARAAHVHDFVVSLPEGYGSRVGERGVTLSGGQRQRLAIARALVKDAPVVLLDEPTAALDAESEALVLAALRRLLEGRTALVVAHRPATVRLADDVVVLREGRIVERGGPQELLARDGAFAALFGERPLQAAPRR